jgi:trans-aconitate methyltransferase
MAFKNAYDSHDHSRQILDLLYGYDSFLDSISVVADMGCGAGQDVEWWATLRTRDDPPEDRDFTVYGLDQNISGIDKFVTDLPNVKFIQGDFEQPGLLPRKVDLMWSHDSFNYAINPLQTLATWNRQMNTNGMLILSIPQNMHYQYNRFQNNSYSGVYYNHNIATLIYMLATSGFDCKDAYFYKNANDPWLYAAVYKSSEPLDPKTTSWFDLADKNLINDSMKNSINKHSYVRQEDIITTWLDKDFYRIRE